MPIGISKVLKRAEPDKQLEIEDEKLRALNQAMDWILNPQTKTPVASTTEVAPKMYRGKSRLDEYLQ